MDAQLNQLSDADLDAAIAGKSQQLQQVKFDSLPKGDLSGWSDDQLDAAIGAHRQEQGYRLNQARAFVRKEAESGDLPSGQQPGAGPYLARQLASFYRAPGQAIASGILQSRFREGTATDQDYYAHARLEYERGLDQEQPEGMKWAGMAARAPGLIRFLNPATAAASIGAEAIGGAAEEQGRAPWDPRVIGKAGIQTVAQLGVLKALGPLGEKLFPAAGKIGQAAIGSAQMPASQAAADITSYAIGLQSRYGAIQDFAEGKYGDFAREILGQALLGAGAAAIHSGASAGKAYADELVSELNNGRANGLSPAEALNRAKTAAENVSGASEPSASPSVESDRPDAMAGQETLAQSGPGGQQLGGQANTVEGRNGTALTGEETATYPLQDPARAAAATQAVERLKERVAKTDQERRAQAESPLDIGNPTKTDKTMKGESRQHFAFEVGGKPVELRVVNRGDGLEVEWMGFKGRGTGEAGEGKMRSADIKTVAKQLFEQNPDAERITAIRGGRRAVISRDQVVPETATEAGPIAKTAPELQPDQPPEPPQAKADRLRIEMGKAKEVVMEAEKAVARAEADVRMGLGNRVPEAKAALKDARLKAKGMKAEIDAIRDELLKSEADVPPKPPEPANSPEAKTEPQPAESAAPPAPTEEFKQPKLTATEQHVLDSRRSETLQQIGDRLGMTKEGVRQIEVRAVRKSGGEESIAKSQEKQRAAARQDMQAKAAGAAELKRTGETKIERGRTAEDRRQDKLDKLTTKFLAGKEVFSSEDIAELEKQAATITEKESKDAQRQGHSPASVAESVQSGRTSGVRAAFEQAAKENGLDVQELHQRAKFHREQDQAQQSEFGWNQLISDAYAELKPHGITPVNITRLRRHGGDFDKLKEFDVVAERLAEKYQSILGDGGKDNWSDRLLAVLKEKQKKPLSREDAYQMAFDEMMERKGDDAGAGDFNPAEFEQPQAMGAAAAGELLPRPEQSTGPRETALANARIDKERAAEGLNPIIGSARMENAEAWDAAMQRLERDPNAAAKLVTELSFKGRPVDVVEGALLLREKIRLDNEYRTLGKQLLDVRSADPESALALEARVEQLARERTELATAVRRTGTDIGRSLQFRKQLAAEDYSLAGMLQEFAVARGREATPDETKRIAALQAKIEELQAKVDAAGGEKPPSDTGFELDKLKKGFQRELVEARFARSPWQQKALRMAGEVVNIPRSLMASIDFPLLRQGMIATLSHPARTARGIPEMFKSFFSQDAADRARYEIDHRPNAGLYRRAGLELTDQQGPMTAREEGFMSRLVGKVPVVGYVTKASERAYQTTLNRIRADSFDALAQALSTKGRLTNVESQILANYVNVMTGRGNLGRMQPAAGLLSQVFFAPKWALSRFQITLGQPLWTQLGEGGTRARVEVAKEYARAVAGLGVVVGLAATAGFDLEKDPRSPDFGKMKLGNTRMDLTGGLASVGTFLARLITNSKKSPTGKVSSLQAQGKFGEDTAADVVYRFVRGKLAPVPGALLDARTGSDVTGAPITPGQAALRTITPLFGKDVVDAFQDLGVPRATALSLLGLLGMSMQAYDPKKKHHFDRVPASR